MVKRDAATRRGRRSCPRRGPSRWDRPEARPLRAAVFRVDAAAPTGGWVIQIDFLPRPRRAFWQEDLDTLPRGWVLYGGTAIALQLGHRHSRDFDFFSSDPVDRDALRGGARCLAEAK